LHTRRLAFETSLSTEPLVATPLGIKAVGSQGIAIGTDGTPLVIIAADRPLRLVVVTGIGAEVNDTPGTKRVAGVQEGIVPEPSIPRDGIHDQVRVEASQLQQECRGRILLTRVGRQKVIKQH
jgi:hypothetical protein